MKKLILILIVLSITKLYSQEEPFWEYLEGPEGGEIRFIELNQKDEIFLGSKNGLFQSTNHGESWEWILKGGHIWKCAISSNGVIFINRNVDSLGGPQDKGEFLFSADNGESWNNVKNCEVEYPNQLRFYNDTLYASEIDNDYDEFRIYRSYDLGKTWKMFKNIENNDTIKIYNFEIFETGEIIIFGRCKIDSDEYGIAFISHDKEKTWEQMGLLKFVSYYFFKNSRNEIFTANRSGLYYSSDDGSTWEETSIKNYVTSHYKRGDDFFISTSDGIYKSIDDCLTWEKISDIGLSYFHVDSEGNYFGYSNLAFIKSIDKGTSWQMKNKGFFAHRVQDIGIDQKGNLFTGISTGIFKSDDNGRTWIFHYPPVGYCRHIEISKQNNVYVSYYDWDERRGGLYISTDQGTTWDTIPIPYTFFSVNDIKVDENENIYLATNRKRLLKTTDMGETWEQDDNGVCYDYKCVELNSEGHIFIGTDLFDLYRSTDEGETWERQIHQDWGFGLTEIVFHPTNGIGYVGGGLGLYRTSNNGRGWRKIGEGNNCLTLDSSGNFYTTFSRISKDGTSFESITSGYLPFHYAILIEYSPTGYLYAATEYGGLYRSSEPVVSVEEPPQTDTPKQTILLQNSPNPFTNLTEIQYFLSKQAKANLKLLDMNGRIIAELIGKYVKGGWHHIIVNGSGLTNGAYLLMLESEGKAVSKIIHKVK